MSDRELFTHLHVHSAYSVGVGLSTPEELCAQAKRLGYQSLALTDTNGTYGYLEFHLAAKKHDLKPIYGAEVFHLSTSGTQERFPLVLLATSGDGLRNVAALASLSAAQFEAGVAPPIDQFEGHAEGVVALCGSKESELACLLLSGDEAGALSVVKELIGVFGDRLYVEIQDHGDREEKQLAQKLLRVAEQAGVGTVFTQDVRYTIPGMRDAYDLLMGVKRPEGEDDFFRIDERHPDRGMHGPGEFEHYRSVYGEAFGGAARIADLPPGDLLAAMGRPGSLLERFEEPPFSLRDRCIERLGERYPDLIDTERMRYDSIVLREIDEIEEAGLAPAFSFYHAFMSRLRRAGIPLGPATGLNLQSVCAWLLDITSYDPYRLDPGFRPMFDPRPERQGEFEIQTGADGREKVLEVLRRLVGRASVAYSPAVERITPSRAVRMVSRVVDVGEADLEAIQRIISRNPGVSIRQLGEEDREIGRLYARSAPVRELLRRASLLENLPAGFIRSRRSLALSAVPLTDYFAHTLDAESTDLFVHVCRDAIPADPIFRIDFTTLSAITLSREIDAELERRQGVSYGWDRFPRGDGAVWREVRRGDTTGVFLFEGEALKQQRELMDLHSLDDLTNLLAVVRMRGAERSLAERIKTFQRGAVFSGSDPVEIYSIVKRTRAHVLYDEQVRDILAALTGASTVEATAMLNDARVSEPATLSGVRMRFMQGMAERDVPIESANEWFERVLYFARQTMRRERVLADAIVVYKLFFVKYRHPGVFYRALLNTHVGNAAKLEKYMQEVSRLGFLLPLDVNKSGYGFEPEANRVRTGFASVTGFDRLDAERVVKARPPGGFKSVEHFLRRVKAQGLSPEDVERMTRAGAFDSLVGSREEVIEALGAVERRKRPAKRKGSEQFELPFEG